MHIFLKLDRDGCQWSQVNTSSGNGLVLPGNRPFSELFLISSYMKSLGGNEWNTKITFQWEHKRFLQTEQVLYHSLHDITRPDMTIEKNNDLLTFYLGSGYDVIIEYIQVALWDLSIVMMNVIGRWYWTPWISIVFLLIFMARPVKYIYIFDPREHSSKVALHQRNNYIIGCGDIYDPL